MQRDDTGRRSRTGQLQSEVEGHPLHVQRDDAARNGKRLAGKAAAASPDAHSVKSKGTHCTRRAMTLGATASRPPRAHQAATA